MSSTLDIEAITAQILTAVKSSLEQNQQQIITKAAESAASMIEDNLKRKESDITNNAVQESVKRLKTEQPTFKRKGNKNQFDHNVEVYQHLEKAERFLTDNKVEDAKKEIRQGKEIISKRQKLIKLADREDDGWSVVNEYIADDLASDSEDEKHIVKARKLAAIKKKASEQKFRKLGERKRPTTNFDSNSRTQPNYDNRYKYSLPTSHQHGQKTDFRKDKFDRKCFICGRHGHLVFNCPDKKY